MSVNRPAALTEVVGNLHEVEVSWPDHFGHVLGQRIPAERFPERASGLGFPFPDGLFAMNADAEVQFDARQANWDTGYANVYALPDMDTLRPLPWRDRVGHVVADIVDRHGEPVATSPRAVLRRMVDRLAGLGFEAFVGVEYEFYLLDADGSLLHDDIHAHSLERANLLEPVIGEFSGPLRQFVPVEKMQTEYGPGQVEINLVHQTALTAADDAFRLRYAVRETARRAGLLATFMAKPFTGFSGSSCHVHISLWRQGEPAFTPEEDRESAEARNAIAGVLRHLPALTLFGAPTVNSYKRYMKNSFAPTTVTWGGDNRTGAVRSLVGAPGDSRFELRTPGADANPYWAIAAVLAAMISGIEDDAQPPPRGVGYLYGDEHLLPGTLGEALAATRADPALIEMLGDDAVHDYLVVTESEWRAYTTQVTAWELDRYLKRA
ncbi:glutamine synthetase family protein [Streptomyces sp. TRM64462]|uniref:glutamine synthetase family protein n=1 Tax=Streptomyces sp. TRM64462 TaxID=2741726 RepID=UPI0015861C85|nr:glutamine synthetase family protein [Streptomyces sp. TRM64462]